ncbi:MAG: bifunctional 2-methylcitrate dehydratase/aconitate hydratase [Phycisphaerales bacterium JB063]
MSATMTDNTAAPTDALLSTLADYILGGAEAAGASDLTWDTARLTMMDALGCAMQALSYPACHRLVGPVVPGAQMPGGARVPGTSFELDPVQAALSLGAMIRWLDFNDTWLAAEWGHPSDNFGGILAVADYLCRCPPEVSGREVTVREALEAGILAFEVQGVLALNNAFNRVGLDHVMLVRIASAGVITKMLGGNRQQVIDALSHAWIDGCALRTYRHAPNTGSRKSWAAGDATARAVRLALLVMKGEMGYASAMTAKTWGFQDVLYKGNDVTLARPLSSYVMDHILFKVSYPAEFHAQTAVEAGVALHPQVRDRLDDIQEVRMHTQEPGMRIINKTGELRNPADRDHCLQYMTAIALIHGDLRAEHYEDAAASDPRIDALRAKMVVAEDAGFSKDYLDPDKRSIANRVQVVFSDGTETEPVEVHYPLGHRRRRDESKPVLWEKFTRSLNGWFDAGQAKSIRALFEDPEQLDAMPVSALMDAFVK